MRGAFGACIVKRLLASSAAPPYIPDPSLPPALRGNECVVRGEGLSVPLNALLHLFVDLP